MTSGQTVGLGRYDLTEAEWWARLNEDPTTFPWSVFADWLGESGDSCEGAARVIAHQRWVPLRSDLPGQAGASWDWYRLASGTGHLVPIPEEVSNDWLGQLARAILPQEVFDALPRPSQRMYRSYSTPVDAYRALLTTLTGLGGPKESTGQGEESGAGA